MYKALIIRMTEKYHTMIKLHALKSGKSMKAIVHEALSEYFAKRK